MRYLINSPRPYEVFDIDEFKVMREERKSGRSFPSRHVFSAFLIGMLWLPYSVPFGVAALMLGAFLGLQRVLLGIHFIRDVITGAVIGIVSGLVGILIL
jgi:membrane-associated phospholipid phosphatase